jgi:deoxynucleoside kinase
MAVPPIRVCVDGSIGAGKTSVLKYIAEHYSDTIEVDLEPVASWEPWLNNMYKSGTGTFEFQVKVWLDRCWPKPPSKTLMIERSPLFQTGVFVTANMKNGKISTMQGELLQGMYANVMSVWAPDVTVYLRCDPARCAERIVRRGRHSEDNIPISYLKELHTLHEMTYDRAVREGMRIHVIDVDDMNVPDVAQAIVRAIS